MGKGTFLKKAFLSPHPYPSKTLKRGVYFFIATPALNGRTANVRTALESLPLEGKVSTRGSEASEVVDG